MGVVLVVVGGFLAGGALSLWRQARAAGAEAVRIRQLRGGAAVLGACALLALAAGASRVV
ncbi:MAG TPA: hypothetical protein VFX70_01135 [Mycobacteriales bacterium]|nr:hypothetical protein [Mycobacteriales bacterium]